EGLSFRGKRQPVSHAYEEAERPRAGHREILRPNRPVEGEAGPGHLSIAAVVGGQCRAPGSVSIGITETAPVRLRIAQSNLAYAGDSENFAAAQCCVLYF